MVGPRPDWLRPRWPEHLDDVDDPDHADDLWILDAVADERDAFELDEAERRICSDWFDTEEDA